MTTDRALRIVVGGMLLVALLNLIDAYITVVAVHYWGMSEGNNLIKELVHQKPWLFLLLKVFLSALLLIAARMNMKNWQKYSESKGAVAMTVFMVIVGATAYIFYTAWNLLQVITW